MAAACVPIEAFLTNDKVKSDAPMAGCCCCMDLRGVLVRAAGCFEYVQHAQSFIRAQC
jgi:hypothetical protein